MKNSKKKAQLEISFNWVFVLIAGAAILFFFIRIIGTETDYAERASHARAVSRMNSLITALQQNPDSISRSQSIGFDIEFHCNEEGQHEYGIRNSNTRETLSHNLVFTPKVIGSSRLLPWVRTLETPFPVSSILYLTDEETKYVFIKDYDDGTIEHFYNQFPRNISKEYKSFDEFKTNPAEEYREYIVVASNEVTGSNIAFEDSRKVQKLNYVIEIDATNANKIRFHEFTGEGALEMQPTDVPYFDDETAIGAIISGRPDLYECTLNKAIEQIRIVTDINLERVEKLRDAYGADHNCYSYYSLTSQGFFQDLSTAARDQDVGDMMTNINLIRGLNQQIIASGCVVIY